LVESLIFIDDLSNLDSVKKQVSDIKNKKIISFNHVTHNFLEEENIPHTNSDEYLSKNERTQLFDKAVSLHNWYEKNEIFQELKFEGINLLGLLDTAEFSRLLIEKLIEFLTLIRIIQKENPKKIFSSINFSPAINSITSNSNIELIELGTNSNDLLYWDRINFKFNLFSKSFSIGLSQKKYISIKNHVENFFTFILQLNPSISKTKSLLFLEFDIGKYSEIIQNLQDYDGQILFLNMRRPIFYDLNTLNLLKKLNCKVLNTKNLTSSDTNLIKTLTKEYSNTFDSVWQNDKIFDEIFSLEGFSFWTHIKNPLLKSYKLRMTGYFRTILASKKILKNFNISCIVSFNVIGETEKIILDVNNNNIPSIMLEHAYANYVPEISRYDFWSMYPLFKAKIAVWGDVQKQYLINQHKIDEKRILTVGSPRHDVFFKKKICTPNQKTLLLTMHPLSNIVGQNTMSHYIKFEKTIIDFCKIIKNIPDLQLIVKLHPSDVPHNTFILNLFNKIDLSIPVFQNKSIMELLLSCDTLVNISPEGFDPSTVMMEALILKIPVMNIILDDLFYDFQYVKDKAILSISDDSYLENNLIKILFNEEFRNELIENGQKHLKNYLSNPGSASYHFAKILKDY
jgi:hypothetical protein